MWVNINIFIYTFYIYFSLFFLLWLLVTVVFWSGRDVREGAWLRCVRQPADRAREGRPLVATMKIGETREKSMTLQFHGGLQQNHTNKFSFFIFKRKRRRIRRARSEFFRPNFFTLTLSVSLGTLTMSIRVACLNALMSSLLSLDYLILSSFFFSPSSVADSSKSFCQRMDWETVGSACFGGCWLSKTISSLLSLYLAVSVHLFISVIHLIIACLFRQQIMFFAGKRGTKKLCF